MRLERLQHGQAVTRNIGDARDSSDVSRQRLRNRDDVCAAQREPREQRPVRIDDAVSDLLGEQFASDQADNAVAVLCQAERTGVPEEEIDATPLADPSHGRRDHVSTR